MIVKHLVFTAGLLLGGVLSADAATIAYDVTMNTAPLIDHPAGPFSLDFQFTDGSGTGNANNAITLSNFQFGGGSPTGSAVLTGATGDLRSGITITDSNFFNEAVQTFDPGSELSFTLAETTTVEPGGTPDEFSLSLLDASGNSVPSMSPEGVLLLSNISSSTPTVQSFATDPTQSPNGGGTPINIGAPTVVLHTSTPPVTPIPEPPSFWLLATALFLLAICKSCNFARFSSEL